MSQFIQALFYSFIYIFINIGCGYSWLFFWNGENNMIPIIKHFDLISTVLHTIVVFSFLCCLRGRQFLTIKKATFRYYTYGFILGCLLFATNMLLQSHFNPKIILELDPWSSFNFSSAFLSKALSLVLLIPLVEEFFFRKYIQGNVLKKGNPKLAIAVTSILYAMVYIGFESIAISDGFSPAYSSAVFAFVMGLFLSILYAKTKSIGPSLIAHMTCNALTLVL